MPMQGLWLGTWAKFLLGWRLGPYVPTPPHVVASMLRSISSHNRAVSSASSVASLLVSPDKPQSLCQRRTDR